ncbi:MAG: 16S rRNA (uracil(1498)-N(3))-methyltransferase [Rikenellaceae bacterium]
MQLFYVKKIDSEIIILDEEESKHAIKVLRKTVGDTLHIIDGEGGMYQATIVDSNPKHCTVSIIEAKKEYEKLPYQLHIAIAPTKNIDRIEWFVEKATEIGISAFTMLRTEHSERKTVNDERMEKVIVSAMKQSIKAYKPTLNSMIPLAEFLKQDFGDSECFIAHCSTNFERTHLKEILNGNSKIVLLIGPEGDFSDNEIEMALKRGFKSISLGTSRLRTETAALYATTTVSLNF